MGKVIEIGSKNGGGGNGINHLMEQASGGSKRQQEEPRIEFPKDKCLKVRCILANLEYYVPNGNAGVNTEYPPYFPFTIPLGYSVISENPAIPGSKPLAIIRHENMLFYQTGISTEFCDLPEWWDRRDSLVG